MIRTLLIITGASLVLCVAALAGAAAIGGHELSRNGWTWNFREDGVERTLRIDRAERGPRVTRTLAWTGGDRLEIEVPAEVTYVQGDEASVVVSGVQSQVERLHLTAGRLAYDDGDRASHVVFGWHNSPRLRVTVTAPSVRHFDISGSAELFVRDFDQPSLSVSIHGSGEADVAGRTEAVTLDISGSGEADLSQLETRDADVRINGSGDAVVGPTGKATIAISGSGEVDLTRRPASVSQSISGSGEVNQR